MLQDLPGPEAADRPAHGRDRRAQARRRRDVRLRRERRATATPAGCTSRGPGWPTPSTPGEVMYLADGAVRLRVTRDAPGRRRDRRRGRGRRHRRLAPGPQHPGRDGRAAVRARGGPRPRAHGRADRRRPRRAVVRAPGRGRDALRKHTRLPLIAKIEKPQAVAARGGDRARRRLRDGRPRRPRHRDAHRGGADRAEAGDRAGRRARPPVDHRHADARLDGRLLAADPRRGHRRRQRDPRRHRRGDALPGERRRRSTRSSRSRCWPPSPSTRS